jgi:accessory colonization factor AcfC
MTSSKSAITALSEDDNMASLKWRLCGVLLVGAALVSSRASGQSVALSFAELQPLLKEGQRIVVTDGAGQTIKGEVRDISPSSFAAKTRIEPSRKEL